MKWLNKNAKRIEVMKSSLWIGRNTLNTRLRMQVNDLVKSNDEWRQKSIRQRVQTCLIELTNIYLHLPLQLQRGSNGCKNNENAIRFFVVITAGNIFPMSFKIYYTYALTVYLRWRTSESLALTACFLVAKKNKDQEVVRMIEE